MKILKRSNICFNFIIFNLLCFIQYFIADLLLKGGGPLNLSAFLLFVQNNIVLSLILLLLIFTIYRYKKISKAISFVYYTYIITLLFYYFIKSGDKIQLILSFLILVLGTLFVMIWRSELNDPYVNPRFEGGEISYFLIPKIVVKVFDLKTDIFIAEGRITNYGQNSVFIYFFEEVILTGKLKLTVSLGDQSFTTSGLVMSRYGQGYGLKLITSPSENLLSWNELYVIIRDRGYGQTWNLKDSSGGLWSSIYF